MSGLKEKPTPVKESLPSLGEKAEAIAAAWLEARLVYPLYFYLTNHFHLEIAPVHDPELPAACPASGLFDRITKWLGEMDTRIRTNQLRQLLHSLKEIKPESLRAIIMRLLRRPEKTSTDRDNIDLLLATYFALCAPEDLYSCEITLSDVAQVLRTVIVDADPTELEWCVPLNHVLDAMNRCHGLREVFTAKLLEKGRQLKDASGFMFYDPAALVAFTRFNFLLRRSFFRLLHADLRAIREDLSELERRGIGFVDCRSASLSAEEPVARLREISLAWRQPISSDYAAESANRTFEQLLAIRDAVERALGIIPVDEKPPAIKSAPPSDAEESAIAKEPAIRPDSPVSAGAPASLSHAQNLERTDAMPSVNAPLKSQVSTKSGPKSPPATIAAPPVVPASRSTARAEVPASGEADKTKPRNSPTSPAGNVPSPQLEECLERIWEQLIEAPPTRGRSMSTVTLGEARILLSAWEVNAFVSEGGQLSEDLRRAVAARALVALAREEQKQSGSSVNLDAAVALGRDEMTYLQRRVDEAQRMKNTEAAVNLGISARRLLSAMEGTQN
ncbi:MAG TPA: hypothetical protein VN785_06435 [Candidatus Angelobacter sp.]|nr:hypothetical protein [Candidatus Angelobacter sp.]